MFYIFTIILNIIIFSRNNNKNNNSDDSDDSDDSDNSDNSNNKEDRRDRTIDLRIAIARGVATETTETIALTDDNRDNSSYRRQQE